MNQEIKNNTVMSFYITLFILLSIFVLSIIAALPPNPINIKSDYKLVISQIMPQGWGFFSKSPRDEYLDVYSLDGEKSVKWPNMRVSNLFGISREGRAQGTEIGMFLQEIQGSEFKECSKYYIKYCIKEIEDVKPIEIINKTPEPTLCGVHIITIKEPMPWSWSSSIERNYKTMKMVKVELKCSKT